MADKSFWPSRGLRKPGKGGFQDLGLGGLLYNRCLLCGLLGLLGQVVASGLLFERGLAGLPRWPAGLWWGRLLTPTCQPFAGKAGRKLREPGVARPGEGKELPGSWSWAGGGGAELTLELCFPPLWLGNQSTWAQSGTGSHLLASFPQVSLPRNFQRTAAEPVPVASSLPSLHPGGQGQLGH